MVKRKQNIPNEKVSVFPSGLIIQTKTPKNINITNIEFIISFNTLICVLIVNPP